MKLIIALIILLLFSGCKTGELVKNHQRHLYFSSSPSGNSFPAKKIDQQQGDELENLISAENFQEVTLAQGSGLDGFDVVRIFQDGTGYFLSAEDPANQEKKQTNLKLLISLSQQEMAALFQALNRDQVTQIKGRYSSGVIDGYQGFLEIKTTQGRRYAWLDNHFEPVSYSFAFCNEVIWPKLVGAEIQATGIDRQEEYQRVFHRKDQ